MPTFEKKKLFRLENALNFDMRVFFDSFQEKIKQNFHVKFDAFSR